MSGIVKGVFKIAIVLALVGGAFALVAGPERLDALVHQVQDDVQSAIDASIDDPVALRRQLQKLEREYPRRIAQVRADLAELQNQIRELEQEKAISEKVVELATEDLAAYRQRFEGATTVSLSRVERADLQRLQSRARQVEQTLLAHRGRAEDAARDLGYLYEQAGRMEQLLAQLELEHTQFVTQLQQLERQIDTVARNERLIELMEKRERTMAELSECESYSLGQIQERLAGIRAQQEARLQFLGTQAEVLDYEDRARLALDPPAGLEQQPGVFAPSRAF